MNPIQHKILLADDDSDDCLFFEEVLDELQLSTELHTVNNGIDLLNYLSDHADQLPLALFLDLNMPLKDGTECLTQIKSDEKLKKLPVVIISTSLNMEIVEDVYKKGADYYICKPGDFSKLKKVILEAITRISQNPQQPQRADFVIE